MSFRRRTYTIRRKRASAVSQKEYLFYKEHARELIHARLNFYNAYYGYSYAAVRVKNTSSRWGSCSEKKNLNFHYKLLFLPEKLRDYVIVHELCHLRELNHSADFWALVSQTIPDYKKRRLQLQQLQLHKITPTSTRKRHRNLLPFQS